MTLPSDRPRLATESTDSAASSRFDALLSVSGADLVFTQDNAGRYLSFYWREAERYDLVPERVVGKSIEEAFTPILPAPYLQQVRQVLASLIPVQFEYPFLCAEQHLVFNLTISPLLMPQGTAANVVVTGQFLYSVSKSHALETVNGLLHSNFFHRPRFQRRLNQVIWNIHRSRRYR